jgi:hypothetical protein
VPADRLHAEGRAVEDALARPRMRSPLRAAPIRQLPLSAGGMLRPPRRRILPVLLASVGRGVEDVVDEQEPVHPAARGGVRAVDVVPIVKEHAEHEAAIGATVFSEARPV